LRRFFESRFGHDFGRVRIHADAQQEGGAAQSQPATIQRQPKTDTAPPVFPDFPNLALKLEDDIGQNLFDYGHHFYQLGLSFPINRNCCSRRLAATRLAKTLPKTGYRFLGLDEKAASRLASEQASFSRG
jgi:Domain of unknown function (DUF4157)